MITQAWHDAAWLPEPSAERARATAVSRDGVTCRHLVVLVSGLLLLPNALIAPALAPLAGVCVVLGCIASLWIVVRATAAGEFLASRVDPLLLASCALAALVLCLLGGEGHLFYPTYDWLTRDAVLADLVRQGFPAHYEYQGTQFVLRAPLAMYMLPATAGRLLGLHAAHLVLVVQNVTVLALMLTLFGAMARGRRAVFLAVFVGFSGIELIGRFILGDLIHEKTAGIPWPHLYQHLGWWSGYLQYSNHVTQLFWVPHHAFPGWWMAVLGILHVRREIGSAALIVAFAFLLFWSPLAMAGALPIVGYLVLRREYPNVLTPQLLAAGLAAACFLPVILYLGADAGTVPHSWLVFAPGFWSLYVVFIAVQIPHAAVVISFRDRLDAGSRMLAILAIGMLLIIPAYRLGANNDLAMRASIMPLALLALIFASLVAELSLRDGFARIATVAAIIGIGCIAPGLEIQRALMRETFTISDCNLLTTWSELEPETWTANYLARSDRMPAWLIRHDPAARPATIEDRHCWPDHPFRARPTTAWKETDIW